jgi:hypothetical protein
MTRGWTWIRRYAIAIVLILVLTAFLAHSRIFIHAPLGPRGLTAAHLVGFLGYSVVLLLLWSAARRAAHRLRHDTDWDIIGREALVPLATLLVLVKAYGVALILLGPFLNTVGMAVYDWLFVLAVGAAAAWLALAVYRSADALVPVFSRLARHARDAAAVRHEQEKTAEERLSVPVRRCPHCGHELPPPENDVAA